MNKKKKFLIFAFSSVLLAVLSVQVVKFYVQPTEMIIANYVSVENTDNFIPRSFYFYLLENRDLKALKKHSIIPNQSLIISTINLSEGIEVDNELLYVVLDLLIEKGEPVSTLRSGCNFLDQLIIKSDAKLITYLFDKGLELSEHVESDCSTKLLSLLDKHRESYSEREYYRIKKEINGSKGTL